MYHFEILHLLVKSNCVADGLSCLPLSHGSVEEFDDGECDVAFTHNDVMFLQNGNVDGGISECVWMREMQKDEVLLKVKEFILRKWPSERNLRGKCSTYWKVKEELSVSYDIILRGDTIVPPYGMRDTIVRLGHEGHGGMASTRRKIKDISWCLGLDGMVDHWVRECSKCVLSDKSVKPLVVPLQMVDLPDGLWRKVAIDFMGPFVNLPAKEAYAIVLVDFLSKWPEARTVDNITSDTVIEFLMDVFAREGGKCVVHRSNVEWDRHSIYHTRCRVSVRRRLSVLERVSLGHDLVTQGLPYEVTTGLPACLTERCGGPWGFLTPPGLLLPVSRFRHLEEIQQ
ncbi:hypothetical protein NDU88_007067 [Pleurodeles waltl]|uniref:Gypsy retrotransposon integrase-like protein 1 n=1 Tax=Pleurodeles waltl TaxID=8319 RepID=A0AAV7UQV1_PLEWA|nr:hypothetical protein NDU88_007067 [Pleurodeles waltl]